MTASDRFEEVWQAYACADCDPEFDDGDDVCGFAKAYVILIPEGEDCPENCPRCGSHLGFCELAKGLRIVDTPAQRWAARHAEEAS